MISTRLRFGLMLVACVAMALLGRFGSGWATPAQADDTSTIPIICPIYDSTDVPKAIPDNNVNGINSTLLITGTARTNTKLKVRVGSLVHTFVGDLRMSLISPRNQVITLIGDPGIFANTGHDFYGTTFGDDFLISILNGIAPFTGGFKPVEPLAGLAGQELVGTWQLHVADVSARDVGVLEAWGLEICSLPVQAWLPVLER
jgi:Proprotein convertase P-domain